MRLPNRLIPADEPGFKYPSLIDQSCKFKRYTSDYIYTLRAATPITAYKQSCLSVWVKRTTLGEYHAIWTNYLNATNYVWVYFDQATDQLRATYYGATTLWIFTSSAVFRDPTQWYHIYIALDTTEATAADRLKVFVNGVEAAGSYTYPTLNATQGFLASQNFYSMIGTFGGPAYMFDGYISDLHLFTDMTPPPVTDFGEFVNNTWVPKQYGDGDHGILGGHWAFADSGDLGANTASSGVDLTLENGTPAQTLDTPTNNFGILDDIVNTTGSVRNAALYYNSDVAAFRTARFTLPFPKTGKWQFEVETAAGTGGSQWIVGVTTESGNGSGAYNVGSATYGAGYQGNGNVQVDGSITDAVEAWGGSVGDHRIGVVYDADVDAVSFYHDGVLQVTKDLTGLDETERYFAVATNGGGYQMQVYNGAEGFAYPITDALPLCTENWPTPEIIDSEGGFATVLRDGNGGDTTHSNLRFPPKLAWLKGRHVSNHYLYDTERGVGNYLLSASTAAAGTAYPTEGITSFNTDGVTISDGAGLEANKSGASFVDWLFSMLPKYGMDIVTYTGTGVAGRTVAHSLGVAPELILIKRRSGVNSWVVGCHVLAAANPWNSFVSLDLANAAAAASTTFNDTAPDSSVFTLGTGLAVNADTETYVAYLFRSVPGFLKVGYYIGNGSANGPRIHTGFRPRYLLVKDATGAYFWRVVDSARNTYNEVDAELFPNSTDVEAASADVDFLSNGFKLRGLDNGWNNTGNRHIYLAIGDAFPYVNAF